MGFREVARLWSEVAKQVTGGYESEMDRYTEDHPRPTFREYLIRRRRHYEQVE